MFSLYFVWGLYLDPYIINYNLPPTIIHWLYGYIGTICSPMLYSLGLTNAHLHVLLMSKLLAIVFWGWKLSFHVYMWTKWKSFIIPINLELVYCPRSFQYSYISAHSPAIITSMHWFSSCFSPHVTKHCNLLKSYLHSSQLFSGD